LLEFFFHFFSFFSFLWIGYLCVLWMHSSRGRLRTGASKDRWMVVLAVMSDWQHGVDWLLARYCRCRLWLDLRWCRWRVAAKGLCHLGPSRSWQTSRPDSRYPVASGVKCGLHGGKKSKTKSSIRAGAG
jgi:hypothetical protein